MLVNYSMEYALLGLIYLAKNPGRSIKISEIAKEENISLSFLQKLFQSLSRAKVVKAISGPKGGFTLVNKPEETTLAMIFKAIKTSEGRRINCLINEFKKHQDGNLLINFANSVQRDLLNYLNKINLKQILNKEQIKIN